MSHIWMSHVTHMNKSSHTYEWVKSHIQRAVWGREREYYRQCVMSHVCTSHVTHKCLMSRIWMSQITHIARCLGAGARVLWTMRHVTRMYESRHTWMHYVTRINESHHAYSALFGAASASILDNARVSFIELVGHAVVKNASFLHQSLVCCSVLQWVAVSCSELQWVKNASFLHQSLVCCGDLQWVAVCCSESQCVAVSQEHLVSASKSGVLQWVAVSCSVLH